MGTEYNVSLGNPVRKGVSLTLPIFHEMTLLRSDEISPLGKALRAFPVMNDYLSQIQYRSITQRLSNYEAAVGAGVAVGGILPSKIPCSVLFKSSSAFW